MIDEVAESALAFAVDDKAIDSDLLDMDDQGYIVQRFKTLAR